MEAVELPAAMVYPPMEARTLDRAKVAAIAESIGDVGLINPIVVKKAMKLRNGQQTEAWEIIAGNHRYEACAVVLKMQTIPCVISDADDLINEMIMIDENLCRAELSPSDRAHYTARRKEIYLVQHPETKHGSNQHTRSGQVGHSFVAATAEATGKPERSIRRDAERGENVCSEALSLVKGTRFDKGYYLDELKKLIPHEQVQKVKFDILQDSKKVREAQADPASRVSLKVEADVKSRAAKECAEIIAQYVPGEAWDGLKANLYAAGAKTVADALTNLTGNSVMDRRYGA